MLYDAVRGVTKKLYSNDTEAEVQLQLHLTAFDSDGFTLGSELEMLMESKLCIMELESKWCKVQLIQMVL